MRPRYNQLIRPFALAATAAMIATTVALTWGSGVVFASITYNSKGTISLVGTGEALTYSDYLVLTRINKTTLTSTGDTFTGAELLLNGSPTGIKCHSAGANDGEIKTEPIMVEIGWVNKAAGIVGAEERPQEGTSFGKFMCGSVVDESRGALLGSIAPINKPVKPGEVFTAVFALKDGKQDITQFEGGPMTSFEVQVNGGGFSEAVDEETGQTAPSPGTTVEISTASGTPEFVERPSGQSECFEVGKKCHWYQNSSPTGKPINEGVSVPSISWGKLTLSSNAGTVTCKDALLGDVENPKGCGPGVGDTKSFATADCVAAGGCETASGQEMQMTPEALPWGSELEEVGRVMRDKTLAEPPSTTFNQEGALYLSTVGAQVTSHWCIGLASREYWSLKNSKKKNSKGKRWLAEPTRATPHQNPDGRPS